MGLLQTILQRVNDLTNAFNKMQSDSKLTSELPVASTPISGEELIRIVQNGTSKKVNASFLGGGTGGSDYDDSWIQPEIDTKIEFKGSWVQASYNKNDWVINGSWMGVALVDTTEAFPPEPDGTPSWLLPTAPVWEDLTLVGDIYQGIEFYGVQFNTVDGFRIWSNGVTDESFRLFAYEVSGTGATTFLDFIDAGSNLPLGWNVIGLDQFGVLIPNQKYRLVLETHAATNTVTLSDNWDWTPSIESPLAGDIGQTTTGLHINQVSSNATDQSTFLDTLVVGDDILLTESGDALRYNSYRITSVEAKTGSVYNFEIILTASGDALRDGRALDVDFTSKGAAVSTNYNRIVDAWPIPDTLPDQIQGFVTQDPDTSSSPTPGLDNNAYGLDLFFETYVLSDDWFYIAIGEGASNSGGGTTIEIVDNLTTQDATKALSANQGYVLDQKIENLDIPATDDFMTKAAYAPNDPNKVDTAINADNLGGELPSKYDQSAHVLDSNIHLSTSERASIEAMTVPPTGDEPFALKSDIDTEIDTTEVVNENVDIVGATQDDINVNVEANKIPLEGGEEWKMTGMIYGGATRTSSSSTGGIKRNITQLGGFLTYQEIETGPDTGVFEASIGMGEDVLFNSQLSRCIALGDQALEYNTGSDNISLGIRAGRNSFGSINILIGHDTGSGVEGSRNVLIGSAVGTGMTGNRNIAIGDGCASSVTGEYNLALGEDAGETNTGINNIAIGRGSGNVSAGTMDFNDTVSIGAYSEPTQNNQVVIGDPLVTSIRVSNPNYAAINDADLVPKKQVAVSTTENEITGATKADNQVVISDADYGDGSTAVTGTLYFIKP